MQLNFQRFIKQPIWLAAIIFIVLCLWVGSGMILKSEPSTNTSISEENQASLPRVKVSRLYAEQMHKEITLYGRTEPDRVTTLRAEVDGQVTKILAKEGQTVTQGQKLLEIDPNDLEQRLASAKANLRQREIELEGANRLGQEGYQSQALLAQSQANLEAAKAEYKSLQLALDNTTVVSPFAGVLNQRYIEVGDLLKSGDEIATIVDLDPLVIRADVTETHVRNLSIGQNASGRIISGEQLEGKIRYISSMSAMGTNTFEIEVEVDNSDFDFVAGMSTELLIPLETHWAIKITPAVMALDESGNLGVKTVVDDHVKFTPINIVKTDSDGVWLTGLGEQADIITLGHGFVRDGDEVQSILDDTDGEKSGEQLQAKQ